ncbi:hypothetical protein [Mesorhizobium sp. A623]
MKAKLPSDATLRSIASGLKHPEEFVRAVFANMRGGRDDQGMRVALDSNPAAPDYCIEMYFEERNASGEWETVGHQFLVAFSGRNHKEARRQEDEVSRAWSSEAMSWGCVQALLGELRGISTPSNSSS